MAANRRPCDLEDMARLTEEQRICAVEEMVKTRSLVGTRRKLKTTFGIEVSTRALQKLLNKWKKHGTVKDLHKENSGRRKSVRTEGKINDLKTQLATSDFSLRKLSAATDVSITSLHRILKKDLHLKPYKMQVSPRTEIGRC